jgi:hypothetical protein
VRHDGTRIVPNSFLNAYYRPAASNLWVGAEHQVAGHVVTGREETRFSFYCYI